MTIDPSTVARYAGGSRIPGWDDAADLDEGPRGRPRPRDDAGPRRPARRDRGARWRSTRSRRSATIPALHGRAAPLRLVLARGRSSRRRACMRLTPALPRRRRDLLRHARACGPSAATRSTSARTSPARCAAPTSCSPRSRSTAGDDPDFNVRVVRVPRRLRHRADGLGRRPVRRADRRRRGADARCSSCATARSRCPTSSSSAARASTPRPGEALVTDILLFKDIDEPGLDTLDVYERRGGYEALRKALAHRRPRS